MMTIKEEIHYVRSGEELVRAAYTTGFNDGFEAAVYSLMQISEELEKRDGVGVEPSLIVGLGKCRDKARECFGRDKFDVQPAPMGRGANA